MTADSESDNRVKKREVIPERGWEVVMGQLGHRRV